MARYERWLRSRPLRAATRRSYRRWVAELPAALPGAARPHRAAVPHRALTRPPEERTREALRSPAEHVAADRPIAGLLEGDHGVVRLTPRAEATFRAPPRSPPSPLTTFNPGPPAITRALTTGCQRSEQPLSSTNTNQCHPSAHAHPARRAEGKPASRRCAPLRTQFHRYSGTGIEVPMPGWCLCRVGCGAPAAGGPARSGARPSHRLSKNASSLSGGR
jgi:hypothetical protein